MSDTDKRRLQPLSNFEKVRQFERKFRNPAPPVPTKPTEEQEELRLRLIDEERRELGHAMEEGNLQDTADALADLLYVVYGAAVSFGINIDICFADVHEKNMQKMPEGGEGIVDPGGKILKPEGWTPPDHSWLGEW